MKKDLKTSKKTLYNSSLENLKEKKKIYIYIHFKISFLSTIRDKKKM